MHNKKIVSVIAVILALLMVLSLVGMIVPSASAVDESEIEEIQKKKESLSTKSKDIMGKIDQLKEEQSAVIEQKALLDEKNEYATEQILLTQQQIEVYETMIAEKKAEVDAAEQIAHAQLERYRQHIRSMEENGTVNILAIILNCRSFTELLSAIEDANDIMRADKKLEDDYIAARDELKRIQEEYEVQKAEYEAKKAQLEEEKQQLEKDIEEASQLIEKLAEDIEQAKKEYEAAEKARASAEAYLLRLVAQLNAEREARQQEAQQQQQQSSGEGTSPASGGDAPASGGDTPASGGNTPASGGDTPASGGSDPGDVPASEGGSVISGGESTVGTGSLQWPVPCSHTVTSRFGPRIHPITGEYKNHNGMDIDGYGHDGDAIVACDSGTVVVSSYNDSYGNYVMIDHGNGMQTLYAHMSSRAVKKDAVVKKGQTIGYLGATGWATGTHCHLEIYVNGGRVDPENYFSGMSFYDC